MNDPEQYWNDKLTTVAYSETDRDQLFAHRVAFTLSEAGGDAFNFVTKGASLLRIMQDALIYWTPERVEQEAYARAADRPQASRIAREVALFTVQYGDLIVGVSGQVAQMVDNFTLPRLDWILQALGQTLLALERRSTTAESRATDLRLRLEFERLRSELAGRQLASELGKAIAAAEKAVDNDERLREISARIDGIAAGVEQTKVDTDFVADEIMMAYVQPKLLTAPQRAVQTLSGLAKRAVVREVLGKLLQLLA